MVAMYAKDYVLSCIVSGRIYLAVQVLCLLFL